MRRRTPPGFEHPDPLIAILVPVLDRPGRALPLVESVRATSDARIVFLCSPHDRGEIRAARRAVRTTHNADVVVVPFPWGDGDYARKINYGVTVTTEPWLFQAGDDLLFHNGWADAALAVASVKHQVVGTNDLGNPSVIRGRHSTHSLVARSYIVDHGTVDQPGLMLHEGYHHNFVDDEFVQTAQRRGMFAFAHRSRVEHVHPNWGKAEDDSTYRKGMVGWQHDRDLLRSRSSLWRRRLRP